MSERANITQRTGLGDPGAPQLPRFITREACLDLARRAARFVRDGGLTQLVLTSDWASDVRWARNRAFVTADRRDHHIRLTREIGSRNGATVRFNQIGDVALAAAVRRAEELSDRNGDGAPPNLIPPAGKYKYPETHIWSEPTYTQPPTDRGATVRALIAPADDAGMLSAGYLAVAARGTADLDLRDLDRTLYAPQTFAQCSVTVRDPKGIGSGWAGASSYDWGKIDPAKLAAVALDKCLKSRNPVRLEPGRYTAILEPQAAFELLSGTVVATTRRDGNSGGGWFGKGRQVVDFEEQAWGLDRTGIGQKVVDERVTITYDPGDDALGVLPFTTIGEPYRAATWIEHGVVKQLSYPARWAARALRESDGFPQSGAFRMEGGPTSVDEMIATTKRGVLVTRFWHVYYVDTASMLASGYTRDGLWLVENGKISKAIKNFRFTESALFALNNLEQLGPAVPVFSPDLPAVVPPIKVREFSFTSLTDAV